MIFSFFSRQAGKSVFNADLEGWEVGDWAESTHMGLWYPPGSDDTLPGPRHGQIMQVTAVRVCNDHRVPGGKVLSLSFAGWPHCFYGALYFKKLRPRGDEAIAAEAEFTDLVRRKPAPALPRETIREWQ